MRKYETVFISDPDLQDQSREELFERVRGIIERENGIILNFDEWGLKKLSYEIKKKLRGYYVCLTYGGTGELVTELERNFRLSDNIMKFMTILIDEHATEASLKEEAEQARIAAEKTAASESEEPESEEDSAEEAQEDATEDAAADDEASKEDDGDTDEAAEKDAVKSEEATEPAEAPKE